MKKYWLLFYCGFFSYSLCSTVWTEDNPFREKYKAYIKECLRQDIDTDNWEKVISAVITCVLLEDYLDGAPLLYLPTQRTDTALLISLKDWIDTLE
jgi:hypothetical protein